MHLQGLLQESCFAAAPDYFRFPARLEIAAMVITAPVTHEAWKKWEYSCALIFIPGEVFASNP